MADTFYITTPIYYVNDVPHIGHAYTTVAADAVARYMRLTGREVFFLTGTDEHGQKVEKTAASKGMTNREFVDSVAPKFRELWTRLDISNDDFIRTTEERHKRAVQHIFRLLMDKGDIYKGEYEDWYCVPCESFWTKLQLRDDKCPDCGRPVDKLKEESYFFRLSKKEYVDKLLKHIEDNPDFIMPESRRNEIVSFINSGLRDLSISRTSFTWGIPVPGDERHVIYVWLDALMNYLSALGWPEDTERFNKFWPADVHVIGKDILRFHAVYWPMFLIAAGLPLPKRIFAHGWWTLSGEKMSKSRGNVVDPTAVVEELDRHGMGVDGFRYFLLREVPFGLDGDYSRDALISRINTDLANDLGNLHFRSINMVEKYLGGEVPVQSDEDMFQKFAGGNDKILSIPPSDTTRNIADKILYLRSSLHALFNDYKIRMEALTFNEALQTVWNHISDANKLIDYAAPWALAKSDKEEDKALLRDVLGVSAQVLKASATLLYPIMPSKTQMIWEQLGEETELDKVRIDMSTSERVDDGGVPGRPFFAYKPGQKIKRGPAPFPRIETERIRAMKAASEQGVKPKAAAKGERKAASAALSGASERSQQTTAPLKENVIPSAPGGLIKIDEFMKVDLRVGRIVEAARVPKSDKLIKMQVDIGSETRQIVGGIGKAYQPEDLVGKTVVVVANLKPAKLMGIESQGMVLAAGDVDTLRLAGFDAQVAPGTKVK